jgi:hypothetical protein
MGGFTRVEPGAGEIDDRQLTRREKQAGLFMVLDMLEANAESSICGIYPRCKGVLVCEVHEAPIGANHELILGMSSAEAQSCRINI